VADTKPSSPAAAGVLVPILAALLLFAFALFQSLTTDHARDFFIYRLGAELALRGESPYDVPRVRHHVAAHFPDEDAKEFVENSGYFLPPMALLLFAPFAVLPLAAAKVAWAVANGLAAYCIARVPFLLRERDSPPPSLLLWVIPFALVLNPIVLGTIVVGQSSVAYVGCVAAGLWAIDRGKPYLAAVLWVVPFAKPHLALPLLPLLWYLGGWRPAALLVVLVAALNLAGAAVAGGSPLFLREYLDYLPATRDAVKYNRVEFNPQITSWNRLLFAAGGPLVELSALGTVAGYLVWFGLVAGRASLARARPSPAWVVAAVAVGAVLCSQVLVYELLWLTLIVPWVRDLFAGGWRLRGWLAVALLAVQLISQDRMEMIGVGVHRPLGVLLLALVVLAGLVGTSRKRS
jgi:hypothetical protein